MTDEIWRWVPNYEGYYLVSNRGAVRSVERVVFQSTGQPYTVRERTLKRYPHKGFSRVSLARDGTKTNYYTHVLVREVFGDEEVAA